MKKFTQIALGLVLVMGLAAGLMPAIASCGGARAVSSSIGGNLTTFYTPGNPFTPTGAFPTSPYGGSTTYYINGVFWSFGGGNPTYGVGNDSGYFKAYSYIVAYFGGFQTWLGGGYYGGFGTFMGGPYGHWQIPGVDGCIDADGNTTSIDQGECNVVLLTDEANQTGYFAALSVNPGSGGDFAYTAANGFPDQVTLAPIPKPFIVASSTVGNTINLQVDVQPGAVTPANGFYFQCHQNEILSGYKIYVRSLPGHDDNSKPIQIDTRALNQVFGPPIAPWVPATPNAVPFGGAPTPVSLDCSSGGDTDYYLCATLLFGGVAPGAPLYELKNCSMNATKVECGPNLADPMQEPQQRRLDRGDAAPTKQRPGRTGR
jgi:hypothetical protein